MAFIFETYGPFKLPHDGVEIEVPALKAFWKDVDLECHGLSEAIGIYILATQSTKSSPAIPWYVGKTDGQSFKKRVYQHRFDFARAFSKTKNGKPYLFFLARKTKSGGKFMKQQKGHLGSIDKLETMLIGVCLSQNEKLLNASKVKVFKELHVPGYMNEKPGPRKAPAKALRRMLNIE